MNSRLDFLNALFRSLDANGVRCCVLRNYDELGSGESADIDLLVETNILQKFKRILIAAAEESGHRIVHRARYVNHSCVFWSPEAGFTRIDFDTEIRWRLFPILSVQAVLDRRQRQHNFHIPHPCDESAVLFSQVLWTGKLDDRYRAQLERLHSKCDKADLLSTYRKAFGGAAVELAEFQARLPEGRFTGAFCSRLKRAVVVKTFARPREWLDFAGNIFDDLARLWERVRQPAGISLLYVSSSGAEKNLDAFFRQIEFLFPTQKCFLHRLDLTKGTGTRQWSMGLELRRLWALFKGGLCIQFYRLKDDADLAAAIKSNSHRIYASRCFVCEEDSRGRASLTHMGTGCQARSADGSPSRETEFTTLLIGFISTVLEKQNRLRTSGGKLVYTAI